MDEDNNDINKTDPDSTTPGLTEKTDGGPVENTNEAAGEDLGDSKGGGLKGRLSSAANSAKDQLPGSSTVNKAKDTVDQAKKDVEEIAKAKATDIKKDAEEVKKTLQDKGAAAAAAQTTRKAAGKAAAYFAAGNAQVGKAVELALRKDNLMKIGIAATIILLIPTALVMSAVVIFISFMSDPINFVWKALSDPKEKEFTTSASQAGYGTVEEQSYVLKKYGYIEKPPGNVAFAAPESSQPKSGSLEEKLTKIDFKKASYQTGAGPACPIRFTYKELVNEKGETRSVIDKAIQSSNGKEVPLDNQTAQYCLMKSMPIQNMLYRTESARSVNKYSGLEQNYAGNKEEVNKLDNEEAKKYAYDKTYQRITEKNSGIKVDNSNVQEYIQKVKLALEKGENPNSEDSDFQFTAKTIPDLPKEDEETVSTMCTFTEAYLTGSNLRESINARMKAAQRSATKWGTLSSTTQVGDASGKEINSSMLQIDNWAASTAYAQNVYGRNTGELISPEALSNTAYGAGFSDSIALLFNIKDNCIELKNNGFSFLGLLSSLFGGDSSEEKRAAKLAQFKDSYEELQRIIVEQSNGKFTSSEDFGLQQLMVGIIRTSGGSAVSGVEQEGWENFNNQSQGFRALSNMYMLRMGGRFLTEAEANSLSTLAENFRREEEQKNGLAYRLFDKNNVRSLANIARYETPRTPKELNREANKYIARLTNPIKTIAEFQSGFNQYALGKSNQAFAASETGDAYMRLDTIGIPESVYQGVDQIKNSNEVQDILEKGTPQQKELLANFEKCSQENIPSKNFFVKLYEVRDGKATKKFVKDGSGYPFYPAISDTTEFELDTNGRPNLGIKDIKPEKKFYMACEIYLMPPNEVDITPSQQEQLFGLKDKEIRSLVNKFQLYKYSNKLADLMVELSSTEYNDKIYANPPGKNSAGASSEQASAQGIVGDLGLSSDSVPCPTGTTDLGVADSKYTGDLKKEPGVIKIRLCQIPELIGSGANTSGSVQSGGAVVNSRVAGAWQGLAKAAKAEGVNLRANSSFRLFDSCNGKGDGSFCARPGKSYHQLGIAVDFADMGTKGDPGSCGGRAKASSNPAWVWLLNNAEKWGIEQYSAEAWHWDMSGGGNRCNSKEL